MFPKPPRPESPRRAIPTQVARQREIRRVPDVLVVDHPAAPPPAADSPASAPAPATER